MGGAKNKLEFGAVEMGSMDDFLVSDARGRRKSEFTRFTTEKNHAGIVLGPENMNLKVENAQNFAA